MATSSLPSFRRTTLMPFLSSHQATLPRSGWIAATEPSGSLTFSDQEYVITPYYDSMVAKVIVRGMDRAEAIERMLRALDFFVVEGIKTTVSLQKKILRDESFRRGDFSTGFIESFLARAAAAEAKF